MRKFKLLLGIAIIMTMLIASGCTGTKTMVNTGSADNAKASAASDYNTKLGDLKQRINQARTMERPGNNSTLDDYRLWLDRYRQLINDTWDKYNDTAKAGNTYLAYLSDSSNERSNVTSTLDATLNDARSLESDYQQRVSDFETYKAKFSALNAYKDALNATSSAYNDLSRYGGSMKVNSMSDYNTYITGFKSKLDAYDARCNDAIAAGRAYQQYCDQDSAEYKGVAQNEQALKDGMSKAQEAYDKMHSDYNSKNSAQANAQGIAKDYTDKMSKISAAKSDLDSYESSKMPMDRLNSTYINGFKQKVQSFDALCGDTIAAGDACLPYLDKSSADYKTVTDNKKSIGDAQAHYDGQLSNLITMYNNLHPLNPIK